MTYHVIRDIDSWRVVRVGLAAQTVKKTRLKRDAIRAARIAARKARAVLYIHDRHAGVCDRVNYSPVYMAPVRR